MSLKATLQMEKDILGDLLKEGKTLGVRTDSAANLAHMEWQECVDILHAAINCLENHIKKECWTLNAKDSSCRELQKAQKDKWAIGFTNLHVLKDQLLHKLQTQRAELS